MFDRDHIYGLDIETDTSGGYGLDPTMAGITDIAIAREGEDIVLTGNEAQLLAHLAGEIDELSDGLLVTWNGTFFDLPFIKERAQRHRHGAGLEACLVSAEQPLLQPKYDYLPGTPRVGQSFTWEGASIHGHLDISFAYKRVAEDLGVKWGLKPVAQALGIDVVEVDRERMHDLSDMERRLYVASDARATRELAIRLLGA